MKWDVEENMLYGPKWAARKRTSLVVVGIDCEMKEFCCCRFCHFLRTMSCPSYTPIPAIKLANSLPRSRSRTLHHSFQMNSIQSSFVIPSRLSRCCLAQSIRIQHFPRIKASLELLQRHSFLDLFRDKLDASIYFQRRQLSALLLEQIDLLAEILRRHVSHKV